METTLLLDILGNSLALFGVLVFAVAVVGLFKFTDVYTRISAVGTAAGLGISLVIIGVFVLSPSWSNLVLLVIILFLQLSTSSVGTMSIARSAYLTGSTMRPGYFDQLAEDQGTPEPDVIPDRDVDDDTDENSDTESRARVDENSD